MAAQPQTIVVSGLSALEAKELAVALKGAPDGAMDEKPAPPLPAGAAGEPASVTLALTLGPMAIGALAMWLAKQKESRRGRLRWTRQTGTTSEKLEIDFAGYTEGATDAKAITAFLEKTLR